MRRLIILAVTAVSITLLGCGSSQTSSTSPTPPPGSQDNVPSADCPNEEYNVDGLVHLKVLVKPQCGSTIKVNAIPNIRIQLEQEVVVPVGKFTFGLTQDPIGTPLDQITPFTGNIWPWDNLTTGLLGGLVDTNARQYVTVTTDLSRILSPGISASQKPRITYLLVTLVPPDIGYLSWTGVNACRKGPLPGGCNYWQAAIKLDVAIID